MRRLRQNAPALQQQAELPRRAPLLALRLVDDDGVQQAAAADSGHKGVLERGDLGAEDLSELEGPIGKVLLKEDVQRSDTDGGTEGVSV